MPFTSNEAPGMSRTRWGGDGVRGDRVLGAFVLGVCAPGFIAKNSGRKRKGALEEKVVWKMA